MSTDQQQHSLPTRSINGRVVRHVARATHLKTTKVVLGEREREREREGKIVSDCGERLVTVVGK